MDCPICMPEIQEMVEGSASTKEFENGHHLTCTSCGFSMTARSKAILVNAHDTLWGYFSDNEAV